VKINVYRIEIGTIKRFPLSPPAVLEPHGGTHETHGVDKDVLQTHG